MTKRRFTSACPAELRERGVQLFRANRADYTSDTAAYRAIAPKLGCSPDSLRACWPTLTPASHIGGALGILEEAVSRETLGHRDMFDGTHDAEIGAIGRVKSVPLLSEKGAGLDRHLRNIRSVLAMRDLLAARVDTEIQIACLKAA